MNVDMMKHEKIGFVFTSHKAEEESLFDTLLDLFQELITHTSGDFDEAMDWLRQLDEEYELTNGNYTLDDFVKELKDKGYIREEFENSSGSIQITEKTERALRKRALDQIFGKMRKSGMGNHRSKYTGKGDEDSGEFREYRFGDGFDLVSVSESIKNAQVHHGISDFYLTENDLIVKESMHKAQMSTVLMIDISRSRSFPR